MSRTTFVVIAATTASLLSSAAVSAASSPFPRTEQDGAPPTYLAVGAPVPGVSAAAASLGYFEESHMRAEGGPLVDRSPVGATRDTARRPWGSTAAPASPFPQSARDD